MWPGPRKLYENSIWPGPRKFDKDTMGRALEITKNTFHCNKNENHTNLKITTTFNQERFSTWLFQKRYHTHLHCG